MLGAAVTGSPFAAGIVPVGIAIDPSNSTLVVANLSGSHLLRFHRLNPHFPFFVNFAIGTTSPSVNPGKVYAANSVSGDISAFTSAPSTGVLMGYPWVNLGDSDVDWPAVRAAFAEIGYAGSVIAELEPGDEAYLRDVSRRIDRLLLDRA